jgi:hypothetical protein
VSTVVRRSARPSWGYAVWFGLVLALAWSAVALGTPGAVIDNGLIQLGVHQEGHLNIPSDNPSSGTGTTALGLRFKPTNADATSPGCLCEGWGAADALTGTTGYANEAADAGVQNLDLVSFTSSGDRATSVVDIDGRLRVTHAFAPSAGTPNLFEVTVTIQNTSVESIDARYRRVMDWDVEPTAFSEYVTTSTGGASALLDNDNDGFATANPLGLDGSASVSPLLTGSFADVGPQDHGARFDFGFPGLAPGAQARFKIYYGAAVDEPSALAALANAKAEVYSLGQPGTLDGRDRGEPNTFIFGFGQVGGVPVSGGSGVPPGAFGRWPRNPGPFSVHYTYRAPHRYLGNVVQAASNWNAADSAARVASWPGVPASLHVSVIDLETPSNWYGLVVTRGGCEPLAGSTSCTFTRNTLFLNPLKLDAEDDFFRTKVATHEVGHALGLCHQTDGGCGVNLGRGTDSIMQPGSMLIAANYNSLRPYDVQLIRALYP